MDFQYDLSEYPTDIKSTFLAFNIRSGGATHDLINEIGVVYVEDGVLNDVFFVKLSPPPNRENEFRNIWDTFSPRLSKAWVDIKPYFDKVEYVTAFNLSVHKSNLEKSLKVYGIELPDKKYFCAYNWAKDVLKEVKNPVFENVIHALNISERQSSDYTLSRAIATSEIITKIEAITNTSIENFYSNKPNKQEFLTNFFGMYLPEANLSDLTFLDLSSITDDYFNNKGIVVTGTFQNYPDRKKLEELLKSKGGIIKSGISSKTNVVVIGSEAGPSKIEKIKELINSGSQIELINEQVINNLK